LIDLNRNYMRDWKTCLHEYLDEYYKNLIWDQNLVYAFLYGEQRETVKTI
jgi:hypothetical protein